MNQTNILLETGTNELEIIEMFIVEQGPEPGDVQAETLAEGQTDRQAGGPEGLGTAHYAYFGVNVAKVLEIIEAPAHLEPCESATHESFLGVIPLRDMVLPVVDLAVWLNIKRVPSDHDPIIVTEFNGVRTGFLVSGVTQIHRVNWAEVEPPSRYISELPGNSITGTVHLGEHFALLLDLERALVELGAVDTGEDQAAVPVDLDAPMRVLLVDDSTSVRFLLKRNFENAGFGVDVKNNGEEAWHALTALKEEATQTKRSITHLLDAVVSDVEMPRMDGYTLTRHIKEDPVLKALPVILFSSLISQGLLHKGESVGADAQITKPEFGGLTHQVRAIIEKRRTG